MTLDQQRALALAAARVRAAQSQEPDALDQSAMNFAQDMPWYQRMAAGAGKAVADTGMGIRQLGAMAMDAVDPRQQTLSGLVTGGAPQSRADEIRAEMEETRQRDAALMNTTAGKIGNFLGDVGLTFVPGGALKGLGMAAKAGGLTGASTALEAAGGAFLAPKTIKGGLAAGATMGAVQPATDGSDRGLNIGLGALGGAAMPALSAGYGAIKSAVEPLYNAGRERIVGRALNEAAGGDTEAAAAARALANAQELVPGSSPTVAQASGNAGLAAIERAANSQVPAVTTAMQQRLAQQNAARVAALDRVAGTQTDYDAALAARSKETGALRDSALANADYGTNKTAELQGRIAGKNDAVVSALRDEGRFRTFANEQDNLAAGGQSSAGNVSPSAYPVPGQPRVPGRYTENFQRIPEGQGAAADTADIVTQRKAERDFIGRQLDSLQQAGYSPLNAQDLTKSISTTLNQPGIRASSVVQKTLGEIKDKLAGLADANGNLSAQDLYTVRKEIGNTISVHAKDTANWDKRLTAGLQQNIQGAMDDSIRKAGAGDLWDQYLSKYQELSKPINQMDVAREIASKAVRPLDGQMLPRAYARALDDATAARATGFGKATMQGVMGPDQMGVLTGIRDDLARAEFANNAGRGAGSNTVQNLGYSNILDNAGVPAALSLMTPGHVGGIILSEGLRRAKADTNAKVGKKLAEVLLNTPEAARVMSMAQPNAKGAGLARALQRVSANLSLAAPAALEGKQQ